MDTKKAKQSLLEIFGKQLDFNNDFDKRFKVLKENMKKDLIKWCTNCKEGKERGSVPNKNEFKDRFVFFRKIGNSTRCILIKKQNSKFIELHLLEHKKYDDLRNKLGYKQSSYYGS